MFFVCLASLSHAQLTDDDEWDGTAPLKFEIYDFASGMKTIDATGTVAVRNPQPKQPSPFTPGGLAPGVRAGFAWRYQRAALLADFGFYKYSDSTGATSMMPLMVGIRAYSHERFRTSFFGEGLAGAYRWTVKSGTVNFATVKGIVSAGAGIDIRLSQRVVWRVFEMQVAIAGARNGPLLTGGPSTGIAYRFDNR